MLNGADSEVLVLGGGLAGTAAAIELASAGRRVTVLERDAAPKHKVCGEFLSAEALLLLRFLGIHVADHGAEPIHTVRLADADTEVSESLPFPAQSLTRRCLDALLLRKAEAAGVTVLRGAAVQALERDSAGWRVSLADERRGDSEERHPVDLCAARVILATGKHDLRGLARPAGVQGRLVALKMYLRLEAAQAAELTHTVELLLHPHGYTGLQPVGGGGVNLTALVHRTHLNALKGWDGLWRELQVTNRHAAERLRGAEWLLERPLAISSIPYGYVRREALAPDLYAVGDQAAVIPSFTGDGMSLALFSGVCAARSILQGESATAFQPRLHGALRWQVARATALSRALVHGPSRRALVHIARRWPASLRWTAAWTRLSEDLLANIAGARTPDAV